MGNLLRATPSANHALDSMLKIVLGMMKLGLGVMKIVLGPTSGIRTMSVHPILDLTKKIFHHHGAILYFGHSSRGYCPATGCRPSLT